MSPNRHLPAQTRPVSKWRITPPVTLAVGYIALILLGTCLLKLPAATKGPLDWWQALFTATSATTVTGLTVTATASSFTVVGQIVLLVLIQIGGLGLMTFGVLALLSLGGHIQGRRDLTVTGDHRATARQDVIRTAGSVIRVALIIEAAAIPLLAFVWVPEHGILQGLWWALFHSVSAFNNAGLTLTQAGLTNYAGDLVVNLTISSLYLIGGLGFAVLMGLWHARRGKRFLDINVTVVVAGTVLLSVAATGVIYFVESNNPATLGSLPTGGDRLLAAWLQATTPRTAGFNTVDIGALSQAGSLVMMLLMFIGAGPNGTGSGIKVTTLFVLGAATWSYLQGRSRALICGHQISQVVLVQALAVAFMGVVSMFLGTLVLSLTEDADLLSVSFEAISALSTVGLSRGLTEHLSTAGEAAVMAMMVIGRLCPLTVAYYVGSGFASRGEPTETQLHVG